VEVSIDQTDQHNSWRPCECGVAGRRPDCRYFM